jgi:hypothetical protein
MKMKTVFYIVIFFYNIILVVFEKIENYLFFVAFLRYTSFRYYHTSGVRVSEDNFFWENIHDDINSTLYQNWHPSKKRIKRLFYNVKSFLLSVL